ncbi:ANM_HP_G0052840.mRNA.1.CDS.1 [Saccharomyces cerevisiae]|nr:ANM_HP_G0136040.mRNA.1.CDS.1 [Saccharomyces cerevisiae]CAI5053786.1 ANM_HP_G0200060.mRNA.1.CDS.1 [Saccharomyces cerevisiae]CAI5208875.1 ANM_HP_G0265520.mRNA.1.CDS.1 [Saccharomyces cerevisiae]CAI5223158.1 ANM_HP_G0052840.mRNA.1.CDS.1 [Saccharomyces cerevisiae]CAI6706665.1 ANM_HP_G0136040.mRNA.1.CDS.1 [Saccharomyces cerevisiae]
MKPPLNMSRSNKPLTQEANSSAHIDRAHQLAQDFNSKQDDTALTSLPHKNPDIFRFENNITAHSSRRGSLYRDSDATVVLPLSEHTPRLSMDDPYRQLLQQAEISQLRSKKKRHSSRVLRTSFISFVVLVSSLSGLDQGLISGNVMTLSFQKYFHYPLTSPLGNIVSIVNLGAFMASLFVYSGILEPCSRKKMLQISTMIYSLGAIVQVLALNQWCLLLGRFLLGVGMGFAFSMVIIYQFEFPLPYIRKRTLISIQCISSVIAYSFGIWINCAFRYLGFAWRYPLSTHVALGIILNLMSFYLILESPSWLLKQKNDVEALVLISNVFDDGNFEENQTQLKFRVLKRDILLKSHLQKNSYPYAYILKDFSSIIKLLIGFQLLTRTNGVDAFLYYSPLILQQMGRGERKSIYLTGLNALIYSIVILAYVPLVLRKRKEKTNVLLGSIVMCVMLFTISFTDWFPKSTTRYISILFAVFLFTHFISWDSIGWVMTIELLPHLSQAPVILLVSNFYWIFKWFVSLITPIHIDRLSWKFYLIPSLSSFISIIFVLKIFPIETRDEGLDSDDDSTGNGSGNHDDVFDDTGSEFSSSPSFSAYQINTLGSSIKQNNQAYSSIQNEQILPKNGNLSNQTHGSAQNVYFITSDSGPSRTGEFFSFHNRTDPNISDNIAANKPSSGGGQNSPGDMAVA